MSSPAKPNGGVYLSWRSVKKPSPVYRPFSACAISHFSNWWYEDHPQIQRFNEDASLFSGNMMVLQAESPRMSCIRSRSAFA